MLFDDPSSSSPVNGDAGFADTPSHSSRRPRPPSLFAHRAPQEQPAPPPAGSAEPPAPRDPQLIESAGAPAPEALQATRIAASVVRELYETGREVRFAFVPSRERVTVLLCDMDGAVLSSLTPARALEIATGEPLPGGRRR